MFKTRVKRVLKRLYLLIESDLEAARIVSFQEVNFKVILIGEASM